MRMEREQDAQSTAIQRLLAALVSVVCRFPRAVLAIALVLCGLSIYAACTRLEYHTSRSDLISPHKANQQRWNRYLDEFGDDDDMVVVVKGGGARQMQQALEGIAAGVSRRADLFDRLFYKVDLRPMRSRALLFLQAEHIKEIQDNLKCMNLLLEPPLVAGIDPLIGWKALTLLQLVHEAERRVSTLSPGDKLRPEDEQFLHQLDAICRCAAGVLEDPTRYQSPWQSILPAGAPDQKDMMSEPQYFFSGDSTLAFLLVRPIKEAGSFTAAAKSVNALRDIVADTRGRFPQLEFGLTGLPVLETDEMVASEKDSRLASFVALAGVGVLFLVVYRGLRNPCLTVTTLLVGTAWAMGWLTLTVGHLNILSATFAVMLIGMGDYGVLWVTRYEQNRALGDDVPTALRNTAMGGGPSIVTAAGATALAFFTAMLADFKAVAELGWIAGSGVLLCALSCFTVLPALLRLIDRREKPGPLIIPISTRAAWLPALARRPHAVIGICLALTVVLAVFAFRITYDHNLLNLQARGLDSVKWELTLVNHTKGASWHAVSYTDSAEEALALKAKYEELPEVSLVVTAAAMVPPDQPDKLPMLRDLHHRLRHLPPRGQAIPHELPSALVLRDRIKSLRAVLEPFAAGNIHSLPAQLSGGLRALHDRIDRMDRVLAAERLRDFEEALTRDLAEDLHRLRDVSTPSPITLADLPASFRERYLGKTSKWLLRVFAKDCLWEHGPLQQFVERIAAVDANATGKPFATLEGLRGMKEGFQWAGLLALVAIVLIFLADFRDLRYTLWALAPLAMGVVISLGIMGLCGLPLNPANMIAFPLILGVGAVYGVHVVHDYLGQRRTSQYTLSFIIGRAILVMALTNMISFGTLTISGHRGLAGLGFILALGVGCCMVTALVFLPAMLRVVSNRSASGGMEAWTSKGRRVMRHRSFEHSASRPA
jgi:hopanoid biosynthesis associated RND transporter like protein HpnN